MPENKKPRRKLPPRAADAIEVYRTIATVTDPLGSYTGLPVSAVPDPRNDFGKNPDEVKIVHENRERPVQDADDL